MPIRLSDTTDRDKFVTQHWVHTETGGGLHLWTLTGVVVLQLRGTGASWLRDEVHLSITVPEIPRGRPLHLKHWAPLVTLNAIGNDDIARDAGWAVDWFRIAAPGSPITDQVTIETAVAVRDSDGWLMRLGYELTLAGSFEPVDVFVPVDRIKKER